MLISVQFHYRNIIVLFDDSLSSEDEQFTMFRSYYFPKNITKGVLTGTITLIGQQTCATTATASVAAVLPVLVGSSRNHAGPHVARSGPQRSPPLVTGVSITAAVSTNSTSGLTGHTGSADHWAVTTRTLTQLLPLPILHSGAVTSLFPPLI